MTRSTRRTPRGASLIELLVTVGVMSLVVLGAFQVFIEGIQLFRTNTRAVDAQASVLRLLSLVNLEITNADQTLVREFGGSDPGVIFASPVDSNGEIKFNNDNGRVYWQKFVCFYYLQAERKVFRREIPIVADDPPNTGSTNLASVGSGLSALNVTTFSGNSSLPTKLLGADITRFEVTPFNGDLSAGGGGGGGGGPAKPSFNILVEAGDKANVGPTGYFIKVSSRVSPRG